MITLDKINNMNYNVESLNDDVQRSLNSAKWATWSNVSKSVWKSVDYAVWDGRDPRSVSRTVRDPIESYIHDYFKLNKLYYE